MQRVPGHFRPECPYVRSSSEISSPFSPCGSDAVRACSAGHFSIQLSISGEQGAWLPFPWHSLPSRNDIDALPLQS